MRNLLPSVRSALARIADAQKTISLIQEKCKHPASCCEYMFKADTGNYDKSDDCYWTEHKCFRCGKFWTTPGSRGEGTRVEEKFSAN